MAWPSPSAFRWPPSAGPRCCCPRPPLLPRSCWTAGCRRSRPSDCRSGVGVQPMLAASAPDPDAAIGKTGLPVAGGPQAGRHPGPGAPRRRPGARSSPAAWTTSRPAAGGRDRGPGPAAADLVLDGEVLSLRSDGTPEAFQVVASRTMSAVDPAALGPGQPAAGVLLRPAARRRARSAGHPAAGSARGDGGGAAAGDHRAPRGSARLRPRRSPPGSPMPSPAVTRAW